MRKELEDLSTVHTIGKQSMKFEPGQIVSTPGALRAMEEAGDYPASLRAELAW